MKIFVTENQLSQIKEFENLKKVIFKYWNKNGGVIDDGLLTILGMQKKVRTTINNQTLYLDNLYEWLIEWRGVENSIKMVKDFLNKNPHHIEDGGYDFEFDVWDFQIDGRNVDITPRINDRKGKVDLIMVGREEMNLFDARSDEDFGWEITSEIEDCLFDYFSLHLTKEIGYSFVFDYFLYTSDEGI